MNVAIVSRSSRSIFSLATSAASRSMLIILSILLTGCATNGSLYDDLGGKDGIERISGYFLLQIGEADEIRPYFMNTDLERFYEKFSEHLCHVTDGPCEYEGDDMVRVHEGMTVSEAHFNATVQLLINAMEDAGVPHPVQNRLLNRLAPMRSEIIYR